MSKSRKKKRQPKRVLALPDLEQSKTAVLNTLTSKSGQRTYDRAITDFVDFPLTNINLTIDAWFYRQKLAMLPPPTKPLKSVAGELPLVIMERPTAVSQWRGLRCEEVNPAAQCRIRKEPVAHV